MVALYVFSLVLGGGFLALSVFGDLLGGHGDVELGGDMGGLDGDLGLDAGGVDVDVGGLDVDAGGVELDAGHLDVQAAHTELQADAGHLAAKIFSIRTLFYSLFGFGSVGTLLTYVWSGNPILTTVFAVVSGVASGTLINTAFSWVKNTESGALQGESSYAGMQGRVVLPIRETAAGRMVVERGGRRVELRALPHPSAVGQGDPSGWRSVVVVEMERGVARVAPLENLLEP